MSKNKAKCIYCKGKVGVNTPFCIHCGKDIRKMWAINEEKEKQPLFCPNPKCHALFVEGNVFCINCGIDFKKHPPILEQDFKFESSSSDKIYCSVCGAKCTNNDIFCDCGNDFRRNPKVSMPPDVKPTFLCAVCNTKKVSFPDDICSECRKKEKVRDYFCPECRTNKVEKYGDICKKCLDKKPLKGTGDGFHIVR